MKRSLLAATLAGPLAVGAAETISISHSGTVHVDAPPEQAFQLFTAPGEKLWVPGWDPVVLSGGDGRAKGSVFVTTHHDERTIWVVVDYDPDALHARYARITPESRAGTVEVSVRADGLGGADVDVTYELTALTAAGNDNLSSFDDDEFARMITDWEAHIRDAAIEFPLRFGS